MNENTTPEDQATTGEPQEPTAQDKPDTPPANSGNKEAAKYRTQLREAQANLEAITEQRDNLLRHSIESHLPDEVPAKLFWKMNEDPSQFMTENGTVDHDQLTQAAEGLAEEFGLHRTGPYVPSQGRSTPKVNLGAQGVAQAFQPKRS